MPSALSPEDEVRRPQRAVRQRSSARWSSPQPIQIVQGPLPDAGPGVGDSARAGYFTAWRSPSLAEAALWELCATYGYCIGGEQADAIIADLPMIPTLSLMRFVVLKDSNTRNCSTSSTARRCCRWCAPGCSTMDRVAERSQVCPECQPADTVLWDADVRSVYTNTRVARGRRHNLEQARQLAGTRSTPSSVGDRLFASRARPLYGDAFGAIRDCDLASHYDGRVMSDPAQFSDVVCSFCGRHNREVRVVSTDAGLIICQVCVASCAEIFDEEVGVEPPAGRGWSARWPLKTASSSPT